ncbi:hypothetical protein [Pendulispora albinea]|uniref:Uncharacterized protein n=1 Tax=Pendulispora albinea TaxID=2741071 RepID=A0ABZ2MAB4_9BACT
MLTDDAQRRWGQEKAAESHGRNEKIERAGNVGTGIRIALDRNEKASKDGGTPFFEDSRAPRAL